MEEKKVEVSTWFKNFGIEEEKKETLSILAERGNCKQLGLQCCHYKQAILGQNSIETLHHLQQFRHLKVKCKYGQECKAYNRLKNNGYRLDDRIHVALYSHPPRMNHGTNVDWKQLNFIKMVYGKYNETNAGCDHYCSLEKSSAGELVKELIKNGYEHVLISTDGKYKHLNEVANEKLNHPYHKLIGAPLSFDEMLSIILYTGTDAYKDLRDTEMKQNYEKWKHFRINLANAVRKLPSVKKNRLDGSTESYHGLHKVTGDGRYEGWWQSATVISTSININVALSFAKHEGSLIKFPLNGIFGPTWTNADVSWISKFPDEEEILILPDMDCFVAPQGKTGNVKVYYCATEE